MTKDSFRRKQRKHSNDGTGGNHGPYGCVCCRPISDLNKYKKFARKLARRLLRAEDGF